MRRASGGTVAYKVTLSPALHIDTSQNKVRTLQNKTFVFRRRDKR